MSDTDTRRSVFVIHGRNRKARSAMFDFLRALDLRPIEWSEAVGSTGKGTPYIGEVLDGAFARAQAIVVLFTPDDEARLRRRWRGKSEERHETELSGQARPNVLFEAGMAMGRNEKGAILVELGELRPFSDIGGRHVVRMNNTTERRQVLAYRLRDAGCPVNLTSADWHTVGDFDGAVLGGTKDEPPDESVSDDAKTLLRKAVEDTQRRIIRFQAYGGLRIQVAGSDICSGGTVDEIRWDEALQELVNEGMMKHQGGVVFAVTQKGASLVEEWRRADPPASGNDGGHHEISE